MEGVILALEVVEARGICGGMMVWHESVEARRISVR